MKRSFASLSWPLAQWLGNAAMIGMLAFIAITAAVQHLRPDLDWRNAPLSFYLLGPHSHWLQAAYAMLAVALVLLGAGYYRALPGSGRSVAAWLLFACAGAGLCVTALAHSNLPDQVPTLQGWVHGTAAQTAFLCVTTAMLLQSWRLRGDPRWRHRFLPAFMLALLCFVAIWVDALWHGMPRGLEQRLVIAAIMSWLLQAAWWLGRNPKPAA